MITAFVENGGDFIDTAISYCLDNDDLGHNERLIAKALAALGRRDVVVARPKAGSRGRAAAGTSMRRRSGCGAAASRARAISGGPISLPLHAVISAVPFADSLGELVKLKDEGKIVNIGLSNVSAKQLDDGLGLAPIAAVPESLQPVRTTRFRQRARRALPELGVAYVPYSPVGGHFGHRRVAQDATLARIAAKHSATPYAIALAWLLARGPHVLPIPGATKIASATGSLGAAHLALDAPDLGALDALGVRPR